MSKSRWSNCSGSESKALGFGSFMSEAAVDQPGGNPTGPGSDEPCSEAGVWVLSLPDTVPMDPTQQDRCSYRQR